MPISHNSELQDLSKIIQLQQEVVMANLDLTELMELICIKTQELTLASGSVVEIAEGEEMVYRACCGSLGAQKGLRLNIHTSLSGMSVKSGEVLYCEDSETDPRVNREACRKVGARSMICVPLVYRSNPIGVLKVVSPIEKKFSERDVNVLRLIAGLLSASSAKAAETEEKTKALNSLRESEALLRESEKKSRSATQAKSEFLANMSHEIRTPLNGVMGMAGLLSDTSLNGQQLEYVEIIKSSAESLLILVNDILDFSKIEARKLVLENIDFELHVAVDDIRQILSHQAKKKNLNLVIEIDPKVPHFVNGDPTRIRQVLLNLVGNAVKFTSTGSVTIRLSPSADGSMISFEVIDTGIGIPAEALSNMFQPFSQVDASTTRKFGGTGLGLSISKQLVDIMKGEIGVRSVAQQGSTFWFKLPLKKAEANVLTHKTQVKLIHDKLRILVAEDNSVNQMIVKIMLEKLGSIVTVVGNGNEVIDALKLAPYDLVLMDCQMPELDGYEATKMIRESASTWKGIHIIAMTANAMAGDKEKCFNAGMNDYVSKPMKKDELIKVLNAYSR